MARRRRRFDGLRAAESDRIRARRGVSTDGVPGRTGCRRLGNVLGVMKQSSDRSIGEAEERIADESGCGTHAFKAIRSTTAGTA